MTALRLRRRTAPLTALLALGACAGADGGAGDPVADPPVAAQPADGAAAAEGTGTTAPPVDVSGVAAAPTEEEVSRTDARAVGPAPVRVPERPPTFERPEHVRGIYLNKWAAGSAKRMDQLEALARRTEVNAFVIDLKDATGYLSYSSAVPLAREIGATGNVSIHDLPGLLRRLSEEGIWPIARIVIVKDPVLTAARPDLAIQDTAGGPWVDGNGATWMNPWSQEVRDYHIALAEEAAALGFPEIQWDYVRFPDAPRAELARAVFPGRDGREKPEAIREFLEQAGEALDALGVVQTADVFGVTTSARDVGIGQVWERFIDRMDVALPMVYPSHYWRGSFGYQRPNAHPYEIVKEALQRGLRRSESVEGAGTIRPWLQDFSLGDPPYGAPEVRAQIQAAYDLGIQEWLLWNPGSRYTEGALMPARGWSEEPLIRVAGRVVPTSQRHEALRLARLAREEEARKAAAATAETRAAPAASAEGGSEPRARGVPSRRPSDRAAPAADGPRRDSLAAPRDPRADTVRAGDPRPDSTRPRVLDPDSLRRWLDSLQARDTVPPTV